MRKAIIFIVTFITFVYTMNAEESIENRLKEESYDILIDRHVHPDYVDEFKYQIKKNQWYDSTLELIALGYTESNWKYFRSPINSDGSRDLGPMGLNTYNIRNKSFMDKHKPKFGSLYDTNTYQYYMSVCMEYYEWILKDIGLEGSFMSYNGGRSRYFRGTLPKASYNHQMKSMSYYNALEEEYQEILKELLDKDVSIMCDFDVEFIESGNVEMLAQFNNEMNRIQLFFRRDDIYVEFI